MNRKSLPWLPKISLDLERRRSCWLILQIYFLCTLGLPLRTLIQSLASASKNKCRHRRQFLIKFTKFFSCSKFSSEITFTSRDVTAQMTVTRLFKNEARQSEHLDQIEVVFQRKVVKDSPRSFIWIGPGSARFSLLLMELMKDQMACPRFGLSENKTPYSLG